MPRSRSERHRRFPGGKPAKVYALPPPGHPTCPTRPPTTHDLARRTAPDDARTPRAPPPRRPTPNSHCPRNREPTDRHKRTPDCANRATGLPTPPPDRPLWAARAGGRAAWPSDRDAPTTTVDVRIGQHTDRRSAPRAAPCAGFSGLRCRPYPVKAEHGPSRDQTKLKSRQTSPLVRVADFGAASTESDDDHAGPTAIGCQRVILIIRATRGYRGRSVW